MAEKKTHAEEKKLVCEELWLKYYNRVLFEQGLISESERNRMSNKIQERSARLRKGKNVVGG